jgi:uncharacterized membrane protein YeaQ/YmgE (transglycosylase-associated protein family)
MFKFIIIAFVSVSRMVPHLANFSPVGALSVMGGRIFNKKTAIITIVFSMLISDLILSQTKGYPIFSFVSIFVYGAFILQVFLGRWFRMKKGGSIMAAFIGAICFYLITNFGVWLSGTMYPMTFAGLISSYIAAIPFFRMTLVSNVAWTAVMSFSYYMYQKKVNSAAIIPAV